MGWMPLIPEAYTWSKSECPRCSPAIHRVIAHDWQRYQNSDAFALHCQQETVQRVAKSLQTAELGDGAMTLVLGADCELGFSRPGVSALSDHFVSILQLFFKSGAGPEGLEALRKVIEDGKSDSGTLGFSVYPDPKDNDAVRFLGVYESQDHYFKVHTESPEVKRFQAATKDITVEIKAHFLKPVGGFLYKKQS